MLLGYFDLVFCKTLTSVATFSCEFSRLDGRLSLRFEIQLEHITSLKLFAKLKTPFLLRCNPLAFRQDALMLLLLMNCNPRELHRFWIFLLTSSITPSPIPSVLYNRLDITILDSLLGFIDLMLRNIFFK